MNVVGRELQWNPSTVDPENNKPSLYNKTSLQWTNFARPLVLCYIEVSLYNELLVVWENVFINPLSLPIRKQILYTDLLTFS